jgi:hypothetical protein
MVPPQSGSVLGTAFLAGEAASEIGFTEVTYCVHLFTLRVESPSSGHLGEDVR